MKQKVLIADDDRVLVELLSTRLKGKDFDVAVAFDAVQAMISAIRTSPDIIVLDIKMPGGTGLEALKKLKASSKTSTIPVIVISAMPDKDFPKVAKSLGAAAFLRKPVTFLQMHGTICQLLGTAASKAVALS